MVVISKKIHPEIFRVIYGNYKEKTLYCPLDCSYGGGDKSYLTAEEKETDVNIAIDMLSDCYEDNIDQIILVTGDSDQSPPLRRIKYRFPSKRLKIYFPPKQGRYYSAELNRIVSTKEKTMMEFQPKFFEKSLMKDEFKAGDSLYRIPKKWKSLQS